MSEYYPQQKPGVKTRFFGVDSILTDGNLQFANNPPTAFVWTHCDGTHIIEGIKQQIRCQISKPAEKHCMLK